MLNDTVETSTIVLTIGHSTRTPEDFIYLLQAHGATQVVDVRTTPRSRRNPQFNHDTLPDALSTADIDYVHMTGLGGRRRPYPDSPNMGRTLYKMLAGLASLTLPDRVLPLLTAPQVSGEAGSLLFGKPAAYHDFRVICPQRCG